MQPLSDRQRALLEALPKQQRVAWISGVACSVAGIAYIVWAISRFEPLGNPAHDIGFDAPVTRPVATLYVHYGDHLRARSYDSPQARFLARYVERNMNFSAGLLLLAFRVILGLTATLLGFATMTVVVERGRLLRIVGALGVDTAAARVSSTASPRAPTE